MEVPELPPARQGREEVVHAEGDPLLGEMSEEGLGVTAQDGDPLVLRLADVEDAEVDLAAAGQLAGDLLAHEGLRERRDLEGPLDGVVVRERDEVHATPAGLLVDGARIGIALVTEVTEHGQVDGPRPSGVDVQIAAH